MSIFTGILGPFTFNVIIDMLKIKFPILFFVFYLFYFFLFFFPLHSFGLLEQFLAIHFDLFSVFECLSS